MDGQDQKAGQPDAPVAPHSELAPDQAVSLRSADQPAPAAVPTPVAATPTAAPQSVPQPVVRADESEQHFATPGANQSKQDNESEGDASNIPELTWTASEFVAHPKTMKWYLVLAAVTVVGVVLAYLFTHEIINVVAFIICAGLFGYTAGRQPRELEYVLGTTGISIGQRFYPYADFRSFSIAAEGAFSSIDFMPLRRFAPPLSVYYDPEHETHVMDILATHLPVAAHKKTVIDSFMHRIRF